MSSADKASPAAHSTRGFLTMLALLAVILISVGGCSTNSATRTQGSPAETTSVSPESYSRVLLEDELVGYVGFHQISVKVGGTRNDTGVYKVYNTAFEILGTFDDVGNTRVFRRDEPVLLGTFPPEDSVRQITGMTGKIRIVEGLQ